MKTKGLGRMARIEKSGELKLAIDLANRVLDRVNADPDDDLAILSRQLLRTTERLSEVLKPYAPIRSAWLIENGKPQGHGLKYLTFNPTEGMFDWTEDVHKALHMSRRKDAELIAQESEDAQLIVEHGFND